MTLPSGSLGGLAPLLLCLPALSSQLPLSESEDLYVAESNNDRIAVFDATGEYLRNFTTPGLDGPHGIAFGLNERIYITCSQSNDIVVFDRAEQFVTRFGDQQLDQPAGLALNAAGELLVASTGGDRICVFGLDGTYLRAFAAPSLTAPTDIALDSAGNIFVTSTTGGVFKWDPAEQFSMNFTAPAGWLLAGPAGLARDVNDVIFVTGLASHNIMSFTADGVFLSEIKHPDLLGPQGLAFNDQGDLFASSTPGDVIVQFDASGAWLQTLDVPELHFPRDLAVSPPCPGSVNFCTAGTSASGCQAVLTTVGTASASKGNGFLLRSTLVEGDKDGWFFYGANGRAAKAWGNGTSFVCVVPPVKRGAILTKTGTSKVCDGWFQMDLNARWCPQCIKPLHNPGAGSIVQAQLWYRDPLNTSNQTTSMSDAVEFLVCP